MTQWTRSARSDVKSVQIIIEKEHNMQTHPQEQFLTFSYIHIHDRSKSNQANDDDDEDDCKNK